MGFFGRFGRVAPATTTDYVEESDGKAPEIDAEKNAVDFQENINPPAHRHHVHSDAEKAVVRKLDWRLPPLVGVLCTILRSCSYASSWLSRTL